VSSGAATAAVREFFHICYWVARTYAKGAQPPARLAFDPGKLEKTLTITASTVAQFEKLRADHNAKSEALKESETARMASEKRPGDAGGGARPAAGRNRRGPQG
jgi:type I restriction enzyme R subunit